MVDDVRATIRSITTTVIDTAVPTGAKSGLVSVNTPQGSDMFNFSVTGGVKREIRVFALHDGPERAQVELLGKNFTGAMTVTFGGAPAPSSSIRMNQSPPTCPSDSTLARRTVGCPLASAPQVDRAARAPSLCWHRRSPALPASGSAVSVPGRGRGATRCSSSAGNWTDWRGWSLPVPPEVLFPGLATLSRLRYQPGR